MKLTAKLIMAAIVTSAAIAVPTVGLAPDANAAKRCGGTAFGAPMTWGPESSGGVNVMGHKGYKQRYSFEVMSNASPVVVQGLGYTDKGPEWFTIGIGAAQRAYGDVPWDNRASIPKVRVLSSNVFGATVKWTC